MLAVTVAGSVYLTRTVMGRHVFAIGGNVEASRFSGLSVNRIKLGVFVLSGLAAGIAAFLGAAFYGSATSSDANGYELYVIASAVVGGASLTGGKGSAVSAMLGAVLIVMIRQAIRTLHLDQNYEWIIIGGAMIVAVVLDQGGTPARGAPPGVGRGPAPRCKSTLAENENAHDRNGGFALGIAATLRGMQQGVTRPARSPRPVPPHPARRSRIAMIAKSSTNPVFLSGAQRRRSGGRGARQGVRASPSRSTG